MTVHPPADWGMRAPTRPLLPLDPARVRGIAVHWPGHKPGTSTIVDVPRALQAYQRQHVDANGWAAIAYSEAVDQRGERWVLRGLHNRTAANGTNAANTSHAAVLALLVPGEQPTDAMLAALRNVVRDLREQFPGATRIDTHRTVRGGGTECPGPILSDLVARGVLDPDRHPEVPAPPPPAPAPGPAAPPFPLDQGEAFGPFSGPAWQRSGYQATRRGRRALPADHPTRVGLRAWQTRMRERGWTLTSDGLYGDETAAVATAFQREKGLHVDALIGAATWSAAWTAPVT